MRTHTYAAQTHTFTCRNTANGIWIVSYDCIGLVYFVYSVSCRLSALLHLVSFVFIVLSLRATHVGSLIRYSGMCWYSLCERLFCVYGKVIYAAAFLCSYIYTIIATLISPLEILPSKWRPQSCDYCIYGRRHKPSLVLHTVL